MTARTLMVQGTASSVGKSLLVTALCRIFRQEGRRVAPFKAQNMALNAYVTADGDEIGRAQAVQAEAAGIHPSVEMNPILLKPEGDSRSQVVVLGKAIGSMSAREYHEKKRELRDVVAASLARLREEYDLVVIEGAGSPAEINLRDGDIVNMHVARTADAPVLLAGDIDRGGVFAALVGTMELLEPDERARVAGFLINKFRGDITLLKPGLDFLEQKTGKPVLGVVPYVPRLRIADEDSASLEPRRARRPPRSDEVSIAVVCLPRIANYDDFEPLEHEAGVHVRFVDRPEDVLAADLAILPGSKSTIADLDWLRESGLAAALVERGRRGAPVLGICGGCQMLGERIEDDDRVESSGPTSIEGLGLLRARTRFGRSKTTARVVARPLGRGFLVAHLAPDARLDGYEIHMGRVECAPDDAAFAIDSEGESAGVLSARRPIDHRAGRGEGGLDGVVGAGGAVVGTMLHGLFENEALRVAVLRVLRERRGLTAPPDAAPIPSKAAEYDRLARAVREHVDIARIARIADG